MPIKSAGTSVKNIKYKTIERIDDSWIEEEYYECVEFKNCTFSDISGVGFTDCLFSSCNLSNIRMENTALQNVVFVDCKMIGIDFQRINSFGLSVRFENCLLDYIDFYRTKLNRSIIRNCRMQGANFTDADLSKCVIENCDFLSAVFSGTNISGVDFTTNSNFIIDPTTNMIRKAKFRRSYLSGLLIPFDIVIED